MWWFWFAPKLNLTMKYHVYKKKKKNHIKVNKVTTSYTHLFLFVLFFFFWLFLLSAKRKIFFCMRSGEIRSNTFAVLVFLRERFGKGGKKRELRRNKKQYVSESCLLVCFFLFSFSWVVRTLGLCNNMSHCFHGVFAWVGLLLSKVKIALVVLYFCSTTLHIFLFFYIF